MKTIEQKKEWLNTLKANVETQDAIFGVTIGHGALELTKYNSGDTNFWTEITNALFETIQRHIVILEKEIQAEGKHETHR